MTALNMITLLIIILSIFVIGIWLCHVDRSRRASELDAALERAEIRHLAEDAWSTAASNAAVIDRLDAQPPPPRRRMYAIRNERTGDATWHFE